MKDNNKYENLQHIEKLGKRLVMIMNAIIVLFFIIAVVYMTAAIGSAFADKLSDDAQKVIYRQLSLINDGPLKNYLFSLSNDGEASNTVAGAAYFLYSLYSILGIVIISFYRKLVVSVSKGSQPFTDDTSIMMRKYSYFSLFLLFTNPVVTLIVFTLLRLFACLFEYGTYLQKKADETNRIQEEIIVSFAEITENKSGQTGQHIRRVAEYSKILAGQLGMSDEEVQKIGLASTMHDIGKLIVPSEILDKPARLTDEEFATIKTHTTYGAQLLSRVEGDVMQLSKTIALEHHERYDGKGYPLGKQGRAISPEGRIVAVADVYDALPSRRSYKTAWDPREAYDEIVKNSGTQFDKNVVEAFKAAYDKIDETRQRYADKDIV